MWDKAPSPSKASEALRAHSFFLFGLNRTDINTGQFFADYWWARSDVTILVIHLVAIECHVLRSVLKLLLSSQKYHPRSFRMKHFAPKIHAEFE